MAEEKRVKLTDEQYDMLFEDMKTMEGISDIVGRAIVSASMRAAEMEGNFWKSVRRIAGPSRSFPSHLLHLID